LRWTPGRRSENLEDRRGSRVRTGVGIGLAGLLILGLLTIITGQNFLVFAPQLGRLSQPTIEEGGEIQSTPEEEKRVDFVSFVLDDAQGTWKKKLGDRYPDAKLVLFRDATATACGFGQAATGPFYCPMDQKVYVDLSFYDELQRRFGAPGEFAQAYVLAHEIGHHVQHVLGIEPQVRRAMQQRPDLRNDLSVRLELQADCLAGVWGHDTAQRQILEQSDIEDGLRAAAAIGDDRVQRQTQGYVQPDSFTHGSSAQRVEWFRRGLQSGDPQVCDTFKGGM
jgi:predicted metalloprotease